MPHPSGKASRPSPSSEQRGAFTIAAGCFGEASSDDIEHHITDNITLLNDVEASTMLYSGSRRATSIA